MIDVILKVIEIVLLVYTGFRIGRAYQLVRQKELIDDILDAFELYMKGSTTEGE